MIAQHVIAFATTLTVVASSEWIKKRINQPTPTPPANAENQFRKTARFWDVFWPALLFAWCSAGVVIQLSEDKAITKWWVAGLCYYCVGISAAVTMFIGMQILHTVGGVQAKAKSAFADQQQQLAMKADSRRKR